MMSCFVPRCDSGSRSTQMKNKKLGKKNPSMFRPPKDAHLLECWRRKIPRADRVLSEKDHVCELHFKEEDIIRFFEHKLPHGIIERIPRGRPVLVSDAIPTIFFNCPSYLSDHKKKRKPPTERSSHIPRKKIKTEPSDQDLPQGSALHIDCISNVPVLQESVRNTDCISNVPVEVAKGVSGFVNDVCLPPKWSIAQHEEYILFIKMNSNGQIDKHIVLNNDGVARFFMSNKEVKLVNFNCGTKEELESTLSKFSNVKNCENIENDKSCLGFVRPLETKCTSCAAKLRRNNLKKVACCTRNTKRLTNRKNSRLKNKVKIVVNEKMKIAAQSQGDLVKEVTEKLPPVAREAVKGSQSLPQVKASERKS